MPKFGLLDWLLEMHLAPQPISLPISFKAWGMRLRWWLKKVSKLYSTILLHPQYHLKFDPFSCMLNPWVLSFVIDIGGLCMIACLAHHGEDDYNCPSHLICDYNLGYCITPTGASCDSSSDCPDTEYCNGKICLIGISVGKSSTHNDECGE